MQERIMKAASTKTVVRMNISDIIEDPIHATIYTRNDIADIVDSYRALNKQLEPLIVGRNKRLMSGSRRLAAAKAIGWTEVDVIIETDIPDDQYVKRSIHHNKQRVKTAVEKWNEIRILREFYGKRQGFRSDLKETSINIEKGQTTQKQIAKDLKVKPCEVQKLESIANYDEKRLEEVGTVSTLDQVYKEVNREKKEKKSISTIKKFVDTVKTIITSLFFMIYVKSSHIMTEVKTNSVNCIVTSPPYYRQRRYSKDPNEIGQEASPALFIQRLANHLQDCKRVLKDDGSLFLNMGDSIINKNQKLIPERLAIELENQEWILRQRIIWRKTTSMSKGNSSSFTPQCEIILWLVKSPNFKYNEVTVPLKTKNLKHGSYNHKNTDGTRRKGSPINTNATTKNIRDFWDDEVIETASCNQQSPFLPKGTNHTAPFPVQIPNICIAKVCEPGDTVLDPFCGSGTTGEAALINGCNFIGYELIQKSANIAMYRLRKCQQHIADIAKKKTPQIITMEPGQNLEKAA